ncbi:tetratricopeptide repeat protein [Aureibaculum sp. 2210JD6-5]|uniref:tetratricopeptide repeat protein n=1 Tax=Aureibaculum sp. 2210JD6-5 TaxID=3103957 RepID=UPI002AAE1E51|nr:tetratricopeptide repeat protein [Aureibaculum sp. 2210JD6-5]MDY7395730.1 tetratricopeptide repeat protein [Aureibaculum sp. 2210JD6-5]
MYKQIIVILFFITSFCAAQNANLANMYFQRGDYVQAASIYKELYKENDVRQDYFKRLLSSYQAIENFEAATNLLDKHQRKFLNQYHLWIEVGYNLQLQGEKLAADTYYQKALKFIEDDPYQGSIMGRTFEQNHLIDYALQSYKRAMELNPKLNFDVNVAYLYGEKADIENMFDSYLNMIEKNDQYYSTVQRYTGRFITDDSESENNKLFKKLLLKRLQQNPNNSWNKLLSWLYMQQKEYNKALIQEKALFKRNADDLSRIGDVGNIAFSDEDYTTAKDAFSYILENTKDPNIILNANYYLINVAVKLASTKKEIESVEQKFNELFDQYGRTNSTLELQMTYADFLTFKKDEPEKAIDILKEALTQTTSSYQHGDFKLKLGDVLVYTNRFNEALINYSQVQTDLKNSSLAQTARFKVAQTSYFKGDFKWALSQLKVLKKSTSQLIANDALELHLLISDNILGDTLHTALKMYAKADVLAYQNKNKAAIDTLNSVLKKFKGGAIEDEALYKQAELFTKIKKYDLAEENYLQLIAFDKTGILVDNSYFKLAELYRNNLSNIDKAKEMYQKIIFEFPNSIFLVEARKQFRKLRGDVIN